MEKLRLWRHTTYDRAYNTSFHENIKSIQHNATLAITGAVRGKLREIFYQELGFESLQQRHWYRKLCCLLKIINNQSLSYFFQLVSSPNTRYFTRNSFFPSTMEERNNLDPEIKKSKSISTFKSNILKFIRLKPINVYYCHNPNGDNLITRLSLDLNQLREHKFKHSFQVCINPLCNQCSVMITRHLLTISFTVLPIQRKNDPTGQNQKY